MTSRMSRIAKAVAMVAALAIGAMGQTEVSQKVTFLVDGKIGSETVKKGSYKISWTDAETGTVEIKVGGKVLAIPFSKKVNEMESDNDRVTYTQMPDGSRAVATISPRGKNFTLVLDTASTTVANKK